MSASRSPSSLLVDPHDGSDARDHRLVHGDPHCTKPVGKFPVFINRQAVVFSSLNVFKAVVYRFGLAVEQFGYGLGVGQSALKLK